MIRTMLKSKIHRARVTGVNLDYEGSITIDKALMRGANIREYEQVEVLNINNAARFTTYCIAGEEASGVIELNGAASRLASKGDVVIIVSYCQIAEHELAGFKPAIVCVDQNNHPKNAATTGSDIPILEEGMYAHQR
ncbi:MAG: aspartate 1-decarboxylase [Dehalococcoidales bacterium]|jgi:aspartate 1-decarboxylase|nr:aspartate 1-decarboxylase [Dehalococcoidales bacterium]MDX9986561.1 aspartate 1-decarboxylase [Dehalococcoidales bacterium]NLE90518.1 aspartate 1-decarboxylase [Dehalococcoidales bacterium]